MTFSTEFKIDPPKKRNWFTVILIASLAFNIFGLSWYVSRGVMESNLPIAEVLRSMKEDGRELQLSEAQVIKRMTEHLSSEGAHIVFTEYALRKPKLDRLVNQVEVLQNHLKKEMGKEEINIAATQQDLRDISFLMAQRLEVMTDLIGRVFPKLSYEDRKVILKMSEK